MNSDILDQMRSTYLPLPLSTKMLKAPPPKGDMLLDPLKKKLCKEGNSCLYAAQQKINPTIITQQSANRIEASTEVLRIAGLRFYNRKLPKNQNPSNNLSSELKTKVVECNAVKSKYKLTTNCYRLTTKKELSPY